MKVEISKLPNFNDMARELREAARKELGVQLVEAIREIDKRTKSGVDVDNRAFAPYTPEYKRDKVDRRKRQNTVNLEDTGEMLAAMTHEVKIQKGIIGIIKFATALAARKARGHMEGLGSKKVIRRFFALSKSQEQKISDNVRAAILKAIKNV